MKKMQGCEYAPKIQFFKTFNFGNMTVIRIMELDQPPLALSGNTYLRERLCTVDLLIMIACFKKSKRILTILIAADLN
jgi:hypothetical protein